jgi:hypothetical protein
MFYSWNQNNGIIAVKAVLDKRAVLHIFVPCCEMAIFQLKVCIELPT